MEFVGLLGLIAVVLIAEAIAIFLRRPLASLLHAEKGMERAEFWNAYIRIVLLLVPAAFALITFPSSYPENLILTGVVGQLRWGLAGILITLAVAGRVVWLHPHAKPNPASNGKPIIPPVGSVTVR
jgi:hypothetical protein